MFTMKYLFSEVGLPPPFPRFPSCWVCLPYVVVVLFSRQSTPSVNVNKQRQYKNKALSRRIDRDNIFIRRYYQYTYPYIHSI